MILNNLDLGAPSHPWATPIVGQNVGTVLIEGVETTVWPRGSIERKQTVSFYVKAWQAIGGQSANTSGAMKYLLKQIEELASNRDSQPVYIQWTATADPAALYNTSELHDGWYTIDEFEPDYSHNVVTGPVQCRMTVTEVAAAAPRSVALAYQGAALSSNFSGTALNLVSLPVGSTAMESSFNRTAAEGSVPCILSPVASPEPLVLSSTISNIFLGRVHVYDTINTASNPVPTSGGTFVNANWVEVFYTDHDFAGDCVVTNGLQLLLFQQGQARICQAYLWNTATSPTNWQQWTSSVAYIDVAGNGGTLQSYSLGRIGPEECSIKAFLSTSGGKSAQVRLRLQRGRYEVRADFMPLVEATTNNATLSFVLPATPKIVYNSTQVADNVLSETSPAVATDYGYAAAFIASTAQPFIPGFLYQNEPGGSQPFIAGNNARVQLGDTTSLAVNAQRSYGFFAVPYGVSGTYSPANLQAEAESGTLGTGWSSVADAAASAGNTAKAASGTTAGNADTFGTSFVPAPGTYDVWFRVKVTSNVGSAAEMTLGLWDATSSAFVPSGSTTFNRTAMTTTYSWERAATAVTPTATHNMQFRAVTALTLGTDWFIDEAVLLPKTLTAANTGPQDIFQQWLYDRKARMVRP